MKNIKSIIILLSLAGFIKSLSAMEVKKPDILVDVTHNKPVDKKEALLRSWLAKKPSKADIIASAANNPIFVQYCFAYASEPNTHSLELIKLLSEKFKENLPTKLIKQRIDSLADHIKTQDRLMATITTKDKASTGVKKAWKTQKNALVKVLKFLKEIYQEREVDETVAEMLREDDDKAAQRRADIYLVDRALSDLF